MLKSILPKSIINALDYYIVANAYIKKLRPNTGFIGGFNMMVMAGAFNQPAQQLPENELIGLLEETVGKLSNELQSGITNFFLSSIKDIEMDYRLLPMTNGDKAELNRNTPTEYYPSLLFIDEVISKIIDAIGRIDINNILVTKATHRTNEICLVFDNRKDLIKYVKGKEIFIRAFGKKWKP